MASDDIQNSFFQFSDLLSEAVTSGEVTDILSAILQYEQYVERC